LGADTRIPSIQQIHAPTTQGDANPHQRPPIGPFALPRMLLALESVDLLQAKEPPIDRQFGLPPYLAQPQRCLICERPHRIEMEINAIDGHGIHGSMVSRQGGEGHTALYRHLFELLDRGSHGGFSGEAFHAGGAIKPIYVTGMTEYVLRVFGHGDRTSMT